MTKKNWVLGLLSLIMMTGTTYGAGRINQPNPLSYSYLRAGKVSQQSDGLNDRAKGYSLQASWQVGENVYLVADGSRLEFETLPATMRVYGAGIGYQENPQGDVSAFLQAQAYETRIQTQGMADYQSDRWARFSWGFRSLMAHNSPWELDGGVYYDAWTNFDARRFGFWLGLGAVWDHVGLRLVRNHNGSQDAVRFSLSVYF